MCVKTHGAREGLLESWIVSFKVRMNVRVRDTTPEATLGNLDKHSD